LKEVTVGGEAEGTSERTSGGIQVSQERIWCGRAVLDGRRRRAGEHDGRQAGEVKEGLYKQAPSSTLLLFRIKTYFFYGVMMI
jgi:hypothetical protein